MIDSCCLCLIVVEFEAHPVVNLVVGERDVVFVNRVPLLYPDLLGSRSHLRGDELGADPVAEGQFVLEQNYPNPHRGVTTVPFTLPGDADVHLDLFDQLGRKMAGVARKGRNAGSQNIKINLEGLGLPAGDYIYRLQVSNRFGIYQQAKQMTIE